MEVLVKRNDAVAMQCALLVAACAQACFLLGWLGLFRLTPLLLPVLLVAAVRSRWAALIALPLAPLALYPAIAFDETLYHLPFVKAYATEGGLAFLPAMRFPVFAVLHEALCVPAFLVAGDIGAHFVALVELIVLVALLVEWGGERAGWLAAALFVGSPLVVHLSTVLYVDIALALFVVAGFYAIDRERYALAGFFFGTACAVKYHGFYFAAFALLFLIVTRRRFARFGVACALAALPMSAWLVSQTGNPLFPYFRPSIWAHGLASPLSLMDRAIWLVRIPWDVTFARERMGLQPPITPLFLVCVIVVFAAAVRNTTARWLLALSAGYLAALSFFVPDSRYLVPLLALFSVAAAVIVARRWPKAVPWLAALALAPGLAYAGYRLRLYGPPPLTPAARTAWLARHVPEYRALRLAGTNRVYACRAEQLKAHAAGELLGDFTGPWSYDRMLADDTATLAERMRGSDVRYYLVAKSRCVPPRANGGMELVYEDEAAQLWRVGDGRPGS